MTARGKFLLSKQPAMTESCRTHTMHEHDQSPRSAESAPDRGPAADLKALLAGLNLNAASPVSEPGNSPESAVPSRFLDAGDAILLLGADSTAASGPIQAGSAYQRIIVGQADLPVGDPDPAAGECLRLTLLGLIAEGVVKSLRRCGDGGLAVALACCCRPTGPSADDQTVLGATVNLAPATAPADTADGAPAADVSAVPAAEVLLFGESPHRAVITVIATDAGRVAKQARIMGVPAMILGAVGGDRLVVQTGSGELAVPVASLFPTGPDGRATANA